MARARNIKPGLLQNELLGEADPIIVLAFACMWMIADKAGRLEDRPKKIRAQLFPYRSDLDMEPVLEWLEVNAFIKRYQSNVGPIIRIVNWEKHQRPHHKENESQLPPETPENSGVDEPCPNIEPCIALTQSNVEASKAQLEQPNPSDTGYRIPDTGLSDTKSSDSGAQDDRFCSTSLTQADFLKRLVEKHDYDPLPKTRLAIVSQAKQWIVDGVTLEEVDHAVDQSRKQLLAKNDEKDPPIAYLAKVVAGNRSQSVPVPAPSKHGGFAERDYANDPGLSRFNVSGKGI